MLGADPTASDTPARPALQRPAELLAGGRPEDAAAALQAVVAGAPTYAAAFVLLGVALDAAGRPAEALSAWHRAAFLVPNSPLVLRERRRLLAATAAPEMDAAEPERLDEPVAEATAKPLSPDGPADEAHLSALAHAREEGAEMPAFDADLVDADLVDAESAVPNDVEMEMTETGPEPPAPIETAAAGPDGPPAEASGAAPGDDPETIQTAPLDDFIFADTPTAPDEDDGFDPDGFDFSAFDLDDDDDGDSDWLTEPAGAGPPTAERAEFGLEDEASATFDPPADLADWAETSDASIRLMSPEADEPALETAAPEAEAPDEAVFQDVPEAPASPLDIPISDTLATDMPPAEATWAPDPPTSPASVADELDSLIASLETAPRIRPDAAFAGPAVRTTEADVDAMASETLARIYAAQHQYVRAALVYETLAAREPARADEMLAQAAEMRRRG